jgi:hypothetical protein
MDTESSISPADLNQIAAHRKGRRNAAVSSACRSGKRPCPSPYGTTWGLSCWSLNYSAPDQGIKHQSCCIRAASRAAQRPQERGLAVCVPQRQKALPIPLWNHLGTVLLVTKRHSPRSGDQASILGSMALEYGMYGSAMHFQ